MVKTALDCVLKGKATGALSHPSPGGVKSVQDLFVLFLFAFGGFVQGVVKDTVEASGGGVGGA